MNAPNTPATPTPPLDSYVTAQELRSLIQIAQFEDLGPQIIDVTSATFIPADATSTAWFRSRKAGTIAGLACLPTVMNVYDASLALEMKVRDGQHVDADTVLASITGSLRSILAVERVALNLLTHLSGIATLTHQYVRLTAHTQAKITDTRKTIPGLRGLAKYAVVCGGGVNHRRGLYDAVLIKDNHLAHIARGDLTQKLEKAMRDARARKPAPAFVEIEVDDLDQLDRVLAMPQRHHPDIVLLDNMSVAKLRQAVTYRDRVAPQVMLEASGGVTLETVKAIAETGVDRIAVGAITHSAAALDIALDIQ